MWAAARNLQKHCLSTLTFSLLQNSKSCLQLRDASPKFLASIVIESRLTSKDNFFSSKSPLCCCYNGTRSMSTSASTSRGRGMRSKVERLMRKDVGRTQKEIRRARNLRKKLMTEEERLIWNLRRAKKKVALLLQKLKKYELPELPPPRHDPELLTPEQLQAYKKIGFRNRNYVPVGVRGVFGGVVQNMHLHWKFHETVQVCCDSFPKEKIKEMATMLARLSGGIVVSVHDVKTIIMFRGRNYRQPKNLIPINTLTKRKALFKARFEQALESQKLNIKKIEQQLRRKGVNPEDPVAMASIQRVASTFFSAIDEKQGTPYVFHGDKHSVGKHDNREDQDPFSEEQEQQQLDKFIADIEEAAEQEWEAEEAAEKEELGRMRYWNREDAGGRSRRSAMSGGDSEDEMRGRRRDWEDNGSRNRTRDTRKWDNDDEDDKVAEASGDDEWDHNDLDSDADSSDEAHDEFKVSKTINKKQNMNCRAENKGGYKKQGGVRPRGKISEEDAEFDSDVDSSDESLDEFKEPRTIKRKQNVNCRTENKGGFKKQAGVRPRGKISEEDSEFDSDADGTDESLDEFKEPRTINRKENMNYRAENKEGYKKHGGVRPRGKISEVDSDSEYVSGDSEDASWELDTEEEDVSTVTQVDDYEYLSSGSEDGYDPKRDQTDRTNDNPRIKTQKQVDETWDSD
ncbi:RNA-binding [Macleaya cordata]|uniref:RNA-binding n=1 Tax=Macleaya cordata TaxID=56857 RepID=A0A200RD04_MACCD|nr:RNA-binding [Macleaya cordata]